MKEIATKTNDDTSGSAQRFEQISESVAKFSKAFGAGVCRQAEERPLMLLGLGFGAGLLLGTRVGSVVLKKAIGLSWRTALGATLGQSSGLLRGL